MNGSALDCKPYCFPNYHRRTKTPPSACHFRDERSSRLNGSRLVTMHYYSTDVAVGADVAAADVAVVVATAAVVIAAAAAVAVFGVVVAVAP